MNILFNSLILLTSWSIFAQINPVINEQNQILRRQEQEKLELLKKGPEQSNTKIQKLGDSLKEQEGAPCFQVNSVILEGDTLLSSRFKKKLLKNYEGKCLGSAHIDQLIKKITNAYIDLGYITSRVYLAPQDLSKQELKLLILEGSIENLKILKNTSTRKGLNNVILSPKEKKLNLRDLEQGIDQINRLQTMDSSMKLLPGKTPGGSIVQIDSFQKKKWYARLSADNYGFDSTGREQGELALGSDDLIGLFENFHLSIKKDLEFGVSSKNNLGLQALMSIPLGYWSFNLSGSFFEYKSEVQTIYQVFETSGKSDSIRFEVERVLHRNQNSKTSLALSLETKDSKNYIEEVFLQASSRRLTISSLNLTHQGAFLSGVGSLSLGYTRGLDWFGALKDNSLAPDRSPKAQFDKFSVSANYLQGLALGSARFQFSLMGTYQWTKDTLYGTERQSIGGIYSTRGFYEEGLSGDRGGFIRSELSYLLPELLSSKLFGDLSLYAAYDVGWIDKDKLETFEGGTLTGSALGLRANKGIVFFDVAAEFAFQIPDHLKREKDIYRLKIGISI